MFTKNENLIRRDLVTQYVVSRANNLTQFSKSWRKTAIRLRKSGTDFVIRTFDSLNIVDHLVPTRASTL